MAKELYVGHISENAYEEDVRKLFSVMGTVTSVHLIVDPETREFKRCGYVRMAADVNLNEVVETLDGALLVDRVITVSIARPQKPGMSKSGKSGGPRKPGYGARTGAGSKAGTARKSQAEQALRAEAKPAVRSKSSAGPKSVGGETSRPETKSGRGPKPSSRPPREGGRTRAPKPRRP